jgi:hypothetical protein
MSYSLRGEAGAVRATIELPQRNPYRHAWLSVRAPGGHVSSATIDGKAWTDFDATKSRIRLPKTKRPITLVVRLAP